MPAADFAAAQQRIAARRAQRAHHEPTPPARAFSRLPFPLGRLTGAWHAVKGRQGTRPEFRVGQLDAELLDEELLQLLTAQVGEACRLFGSHVTDHWTPEILLGLRLVLFKLSIWDQNASYGAHLQGLRYTDARATAPNRPPPKPWQKAAYGLVTIGGRYAWAKWEEYLLSSQDDYTRPESPQLRLLSALTERLTAFHDIASLASFLVFLVSGRYRTITDRLLRLRLTPTSHSTSRQVSFEYLNRQLVWHAFTEFLLFLLPLVGISRWRRILARTWRKLGVSFLSLLGRSTPSSEDTDTDAKSGELSFLPERTCAICYRDQNPSSASEADLLASSAGGGGVVGSAATDITNPYQATPCACIYCFACLAQRIANEEGDGWTCLRCGETITQCAPWAGDILEPKPRRSDAAQLHTPQSTAKAVCFATHDPLPPDEKNPLRNVDPIPHHDDDP
ncbi:Pex12 amino terminal region-domain-containing protein, partial [Ampelomyces quisqualis]